MTCKDCGMTIGWDCECDTEYNRLVEETLRAEKSSGETRSREPVGRGVSR